jgi:hypothetical protein
MADPQRSALVVLKPGQRADVDPSRANEVPPADDVVQQVRRAFADAGFDVGPFIGISFAITGSEAVFERAFGVDPLDAKFRGPQLPLDRMGEEITQHVAAVTLTEPPAFGPGNP